MENTALKKLNNLHIRILLIFTINTVFYLTSFLSVLEFYYLLALILMTSVFEVVVFLIPDFKYKIARLIHALIYFAFSFSKIFMSINYLQYGNCDIFSRSSQIKYLRDSLDYFAMQINLPNLSIAILSIIAAIMIYNHISFGLGKNKQFLLYFVIVYLLCFFFLKENLYFEYYKTMTYSYFGRYEREKPSKEQLEKSFDEAIEISTLAYKDKTSNLADKELVNSRKNIFKSFKNENAFTGLTKDKNVLIIQVESLQNAFIGKSYQGKEICPNLNKLLKNSIYFTDYFELIGFGNSSDSEYVSLQSTYSNLKNGAFVDYSVSDTMGLVSVAKAKGYKCFSMHGNSGDYYCRSTYHPNIGFESSYFGEYYEQDEIIGMGLSDSSFFRQSVPVIEQNNDDKWLAFLITVSCHVPYNMPKEYQYFDTDLSTNFERYLNAVHYGDAALGDFLGSLDEKGILDNTVVAIYGDHHAHCVRDRKSAEQLSKFLGYDFDYDEMLNVPLIIYSKDFEKPLVYDNIGSQLDFMPTMMNLMGWNDVATPMFGVDLLDEKMSADNIVYPQIYIPYGSYIREKDLFLEEISGESNLYVIDRNTREKYKDLYYEILQKEGEELINLANYIYENDKVFELIEAFESNTL